MAAATPYSEELFIELAKAMEDVLKHDPTGKTIFQLAQKVVFPTSRPPSQSFASSHKRKKSIETVDSLDPDDRPGKSLSEGGTELELTRKDQQDAGGGADSFKTATPPSVSLDPQDQDHFEPPQDSMTASVRNEPPLTRNRRSRRKVINAKDDSLAQEQPGSIMLPRQHQTDALTVSPKRSKRHTPKKQKQDS